MGAYIVLISKALNTVPKVSIPKRLLGLKYSNAITTWDSRTFCKVNAVYRDFFTETSSNLPTTGGPLQ